jgi:hypothetical protein
MSKFRHKPMPSAYDAVLAQSAASNKTIVTVTVKETKAERMEAALTAIKAIAVEGAASTDATAWVSIERLCKEGLGE